MFTKIIDSLKCYCKEIYGAFTRLFTSEKETKAKVEKEDVTEAEILEQARIKEDIELLHAWAVARQKKFRKVIRIKRDIKSSINRKSNTPKYPAYIPVKQPKVWF